MSFNPNEITLGRAFSNNVQYEIPRYQRKYVWNEKQWKNLIEDIINTMNSTAENNHFIGSFIYEKKKTNWLIVDGQQRLTTLTLLISALCKIFLQKEQVKLYKGIKKYCVLTMDDGSEKMRLINDESTVFSNVVYDYSINSKINQSLNDFIKNEGIKISKYNKSFVDCYNFFVEYINGVISDFSEPDQLKWLTNFRDAIINLRALEITVDKEQEGYIIFEVLNSRGLPLEQHELIKNFIFMYYKSSVGSDIAKDKWDEIINNVDGQSLSSLKRFISHYITHKFGKVAKKDEYAKIRQEVSKDSVKDFLDDLLLKSEIYGSFIKVDEQRYTPKINYVLNFLNDTRNYQFRPVLLSLFEAMEHGLISASKVERYLMSIKNFLAIFVVVCKEKTNAIEKLVYDYSLSLHKDFSKELMDDFIDKLFDKINKELFVSDFCQIEFTNNKKHSSIKRNCRKEVRLILEEYEIYLSKIDDYKLTHFTIEHIMPDSLPEPEVCLIGNMLPLVTRLNKKLDNSDVCDKISEYKKSPFVSVSEFVDLYERNNVWNVERIKKRSEKLAKRFINEIWIKY